MVATTLQSPDVPTRWQLFFFFFWYVCYLSIPRHSQERWTFVALPCLLYRRVEAQTHKQLL